MTYDTHIGAVRVGRGAKGSHHEQILRALEETVTGGDMSASPKSQLPNEIELCRKCQAALIFHLRGDANTRPYCAKCGARESGIFYVRKELVQVQ